MTNPNEQMPEEPDGVRWLKMLNRPDLIGKEFTLPSGSTILAENFPDLSEEGANIMFVLEEIGPQHPLYERKFKSAEGYVLKYFGPPTENRA